MRNHFFNTEKDKKTWNINQCKKRLNKKGNRENVVFRWKREDRKREFCCSIKRYFFFGTVFYIKKRRDNKKTKKV